MQTLQLMHGAYLSTVPQKLCQTELSSLVHKLPLKYLQLEESNWFH